MLSVACQPLWRYLDDRVVPAVVDRFETATASLRTSAETICGTVQALEERLGSPAAIVWVDADPPPPALAAMAAALGVPLCGPDAVPAGHRAVTVGTGAAGTPDPPTVRWPDAGR